MTKTDMYLELFNKYQDKQIIVAVEELSELQKELCKYLRGNCDMSHLTEEIADVEIMLEQIKLFFNIDKQLLGTLKQYKLDRTKKRLLKGE